MIEHKRHAETALDALNQARAAAHAADDRHAADQYTAAIQKISRITDTVTPTGQIIADQLGTPGLTQISTHGDDYRLTFADGSTLTATVTTGHGHMATLDGRRHDWTITGPAAEATGAMQINQNSHRDLDLIEAIRNTAPRKPGPTSTPAGQTRPR